MTLRIVGIDLAWGERNGDGLCLVHAHGAPGDPGTGCQAETVEAVPVFGDDALFAWLEARLPPGEGALLLFDAPLVCPNATGSRPVDRLLTSRFGRFHAGPHPANAARCGRPLRLARALEERGYEIGWRLDAPGARVMAEVFPHPATVRLLGLERIVKYKRGPVAARRAEFARLQGLLRECLRTRFAPGEWEETPALAAVLAAPWTKPAEDRADALICALIGYHHWRHEGRRSEVCGDLETGFILLPAEGENAKCKMQNAKVRKGE